MKGQLRLFDFIEKPKSILEMLDLKTDDPICRCTNCLCNYCANNVESINIKQGEMIEPCFDCDYCRHFSGEMELCSMEKENCNRFEISDYAAKRKRDKFKIIKGE